MKNILNNFLTPEQQKVLLFLICLGLVGIAVKYTGLVASEQEENIAIAESLQEDYQIKYDLKTVTSTELQTIPGIGPKTAETIIAYRDSIGFQKPQDLLQVKGIGRKTYAKIHAYFIGAQPLSSQNLQGETKLTKININKASIDELTGLPGIGTVKAEKIVKFREENGDFTKFDDILQVKGIGEKTLEKLKPLLSLE
ncbi:MAG: competence protein ComEA [Candidatus Cloacimonadota bacterium]|jgi:competence protein ComEA|nr:competence protein ComEA [Candidatus Cloacimonadota bacterium]